MPRFLIVVPAYNEGSSIRSVLTSLLALDPSADILVVDDGSRDATAAIARDSGVRLVRHPCNLGYGAALQTGYKYAAEHDYDYVVQFDSDGQHDVADLKKILAAAGESPQDVWIGSRFLGSESYHPGWMKMTAILFFRAVIKLFARQRITDPTSGLRMLSRKAFQYFAQNGAFPPDFPDADIILQMLFHPFAIREIPIGARARTEGKSMHDGIRPLIYFLKMLLSISSVLIAHQADKRRRAA